MRTKHYFFIIFSLLLVLAESGYSQSKYILYITDSQNDSGFVSLLTKQGYNVSVKLGTYQGTLSQAQLDSANAATLIIMSRSCSTNAYGGTDALATQWNGITAPLINLSAWLSRSNRWQWFNSTSIGCQVDTLMTATSDGLGDPLFKGVKLPNDGSFDPYDSIGSDVINVADAGYGTTLAMVGSYGVMMAEWTSGTGFYSTTSQTAGGTRIYFSAGESDCGANKGVAKVARYNLNDSIGKVMFLNEVAQFYPLSTGGTAIKENEYNPVSLNVYPNPVTSLLKVNFKAERSGQAVIDILDITGKVIFEKTLPYTVGINNTEVNVSNLAQGVYMLKLTTENNKVVQRVVVR